MKRSAKLLTLVLSLVLVAALSIGGTMAFLTVKTDPVINTFVYGDIDLDLKEENPGPYDVVPGTDIVKDPKITVKAGSENCWLFVRVTENNWSDKLIYSVADGWTKGQGTDGIPTDVFYREVLSKDADQAFEVLKDNKVTVSDQLAKGEISGDSTLTITAYAVQRTGIDTAAEAWAAVSE